ncbi:MAG: MTAP family purine nucleoside phosphorylase [Planctomycetes bacterium]|nr:MTAP family purine nucleoside phosphorylase [Planctomycetota bacterium]
MAKKRQEPAFAVIGGSTAYEFLTSGAIRGERLDRVDTPFGASQPVYRVEAESGPYFFMSRHGETNFDISAPFVNYRANIYALKELGVRQILSWSGAGALRDDIPVGHFVVVDDLLDFTKNRETTFFRFKGLGFMRQKDPFCPTVRSAAIAALQETGCPFADRGVYVCTEGPRLETPAEVRMFVALGGDLVGMTLCPEVFLARELEMCYASISYVTNYTEGIKDRGLKPGRLFEGLSTRREQKKVATSFKLLPELIAKVAELLLNAKPICHCQEAMRYYRRRSGVGRDWREWLNP